MTIKEETLEGLLVRAVYILAQLACSSKLSNSEAVKVRQSLVAVLGDLNDAQCKNAPGGLHGRS